MDNVEIEQKIVLITGGAGFIGSNFIGHLLGKYENYKIINFDKLTYAGNLNNLLFVEDHPNYTFIRGDITVMKDVENVFEQFNPDYVLNFAAETHVDRSIVYPNRFLETNVMGTQNLIDQARENKLIRFIQISTDEVYGPHEQTDKCQEDCALKPDNPYSASKAAADHLVLTAQNTYGLSVNIIRSCNNYGPFQFPEKFIPLAINNVLQKEKVPVYGKGQHIRNWLYVKDLCKAIDLVMHRAEKGEIYNVSTDEYVENIELVKRILQKTDAPEELITLIKDRPGHDFCYSTSYAKIAEELGWKPEISLQEGLTQTIMWYQNHQNWLQEINTGDYLRINEKFAKTNLMET